MNKGFMSSLGKGQQEGHLEREHKGDSNLASKKADFRRLAFPACSGQLGRPPEAMSPSTQPVNSLRRVLPVCGLPHL